MKTIKVLSATPLKDNQVQKIQQHFIHSNSEEVRFEFKVVPTLLGGITVLDGNTVYDSSISGKLAAIKQALK